MKYIPKLLKMKNQYLNILVTICNSQTKYINTNCNRFYRCNFTYKLQLAASFANNQTAPRFKPNIFAIVNTD